MRFGERLRYWRISKNVSTYKFCKYGLSPSNLVSIEKGRRFGSDKNLISIASVPEMEIDYATLKGWQLEEKFNKNHMVKN